VNANLADPNKASIILVGHSNNQPFPYYRLSTILSLLHISQQDIAQTYREYSQRDA